MIFFFFASTSILHYEPVDGEVLKSLPTLPIMQNNRSCPRRERDGHVAAKLATSFNTPQLVPSFFLFFF